jgi:hypothetical protein
LPDGKFLGDDDGNTMNIPGKRIDPTAKDKLTLAARSYGFSDGRAVFLQGRRRVTDEEFEEQVARQQMGLVPDPFDIGAINDEMRGKRYNG